LSLPLSRCASLGRFAFQVIVYCKSISYHSTKEQSGHVRGIVFVWLSIHPGTAIQGLFHPGGQFLWEWSPRLNISFFPSLFFFLSSGKVASSRTPFVHTLLSSRSPTNPYDLFPFVFSISASGCLLFLVRPAGLATSSQSRFFLFPFPLFFFCIKIVRHAATHLAQESEKVSDRFSFLLQAGTPSSPNHRNQRNRILT